MKRPFLLLIVMIFIWMLSGCQPKTKTTRSEAEPLSQEPQTTYTLEDILGKK